MVNDTQQIPAGYKQTDVGVIPEEWDVQRLGDVCVKIQDGNYGESYPKSNEFLTQGVPFLTSKAIGKDGVLKVDLIDFISEKKHEILAKAHIELNDILFTNRGASVGAIGYVDKRVAGGNIGPQLTLIRVDQKSITSRFLYELMKSFVFQEQIFGQDNGSAMNFFGIGQTIKFQIIIPSKKEQKKIVNVLSDIDSLISKLDQLIQKKKNIKHGAMQELLTGKRRLPGFSGVWKDATLEELERAGKARLFRGKVISKKDIDSFPGNYPIYSSSIHNNGKFGQYGKYMFDEELITWSVDGGGNFFYRPKHKFSVTNVCGYIRLTTSSIRYDFLAFQLQQLHSYLSFDYTMKAHPSIIRKAYSLKLPSVEEQAAIAQILLEMGIEIDALEVQKTKYMNLKQGMMQQLLTGKIRLI